MPDVPNPGSDEAIKAGCICPVVDNDHGRGYHGEPGVFVMVATCPLHQGLFAEAEHNRKEPGDA